MDEDMLPNFCHPRHCNRVDRPDNFRPIAKWFHGNLGVVLTLVISVCWSIGRPNEATADEASDKNHAANRVLLQKCISCHGPEKQEGGLRLDSKEAAIHGGDRGPSIVPGDLDKSLMIRAIRFDDPDLQMPPKQKLSDAEIESLTGWVNAGAEWPSGHSDGTAKASANFGPTISDDQNPIRKLFLGERLDLWSLKPVVSSPATTSVDGSNLIDTFIEKSLAEAKLKPSPPADPRTWIRRVTFDLTGLPPNADDVMAFVSDSSDAAYEQLVDRLLNSPQYGERQARLWLDVVRYADTHGYERDEFRPLMWWHPVVGRKCCVN